MKKLLIISNVYPHEQHSVRAANVVIYELVKALVSLKIMEIEFLCVRRFDDASPTDIEKNGLKMLDFEGVRVHQDLMLPQTPQKRHVLKKLFNPKKSDFYPESVFSDLVEEAVNNIDPDYVFIPWSEWLTACCSSLKYKKFAYYGNPDHKTAKHRYVFDQKYKLTKHSYLKHLIYLKFLEYFHLKNMKEYDALGNVAKNDADYYIKNGHQNAFYIKNIWIKRNLNEQSEAGLNEQVKQRHDAIICNLGQVNATANRYGIELVGKELAPLLEKKLVAGTYELMICGNGTLPKNVLAEIGHSTLNFRGFVDDIDDELMKADAFVCLNNASPFKVCHTRYLHAWSLGTCVIAHRDVTHSLPEMRHGYNCLLGNSISEVADMIKEVLSNEHLKRKIGDGGLETFTNEFQAGCIAPQIVQTFERLN